MSESGNRVYVNVSMGNKIFSIADMLVCMLWGDRPYYERLEYEISRPSISIDQCEVKETESLPICPINIPSPESLKVISIISKNQDGGIAKKS